MATPYLFKRLRKISEESKIVFEIDETKTGVGTTGKMWAHEHWILSTPVDIAAFGGKVGISGFYSIIDLRLDQIGYGNFNWFTLEQTW
jgi:4-aminobutyrate aminotransferase/(S)-3-amino-2-methylpropionate transaminase